MPSITLNLNVENAPNPVRKHFEKTNRDGWTDSGSKNIAPAESVGGGSKHDKSLVQIHANTQRTVNM